MNDSSDVPPERYEWFGGKYGFIKIMFWTGILLFEAWAVIIIALGFNSKMSPLSAPGLFGIMLAIDAVMLWFIKGIETDSI